MSMRKPNSEFLLSTNVGVALRVRRAVHLNDLVLVKRIIKSHPEKLQNPDYDDDGNTSLHLAARLGLVDIANYLIDAGHEDESISRNANGDTPLHLAVETSLPVATLLATTFPHCIAWKNKQGADSIMLSARSSPSPPSSTTTTTTTTTTSPTATISLPPFHQRTISTSFPPPLLTTLLALSPVPTPTLLAQADDDGNTALHYASAYEQLRAIRALLAAGASPGAKNRYSWTPVAYSCSVQAEVYFKGLVGAAGSGDGGGGDGGGGGGFRREGAGEVGGGLVGGGLVRGGVGGGGGGLRIVRNGEDGGREVEGREGVGRRRAGSAD